MDKQKPAINTLVFDLGAVLLRWQPAEIARRFTTDLAQQQRLLDNIFLSDTWKAMDRGDISETHAHQIFAEQAGLDQDQMISLWQLIKASLTPIAPMVRLLQQAGDAGYKLYGLSNICADLFDHLSQQYLFFQRFDHIVVSARVGLAKPEVEIYRLVLQRAGVKPEAVLFIDDMAVNIEAAARLGFNTLHCIDPQETAEQARQLLTGLHAGVIL